MEKIHKEEIIKLFEVEYPELSGEFKKIQIEMYELFAAKHMDYGLNNFFISLSFIPNLI